MAAMYNLRKISPRTGRSERTHTRKEWLFLEKWGCQGELLLYLYCLSDYLIKRMYSGTAFKRQEEG